jgi:hypothetical protein
VRPLEVVSLQEIHESHRATAPREAAPV